MARDAVDDIGDMIALLPWPMRIPAFLVAMGLFVGVPFHLAATFMRTMHVPMPFPLGWFG